MNKRAVTLHGDQFTAIGKKLEVGQKAPEFKLIDNALQTKSLGDYGKGVKLISIVPSLDTGVCDQQTRRFNEEISSIPGATVITVSVDLPFAQKRWCGAAGLDKAVTLSDHKDVTFGEAYGVLIEELRLLARAVLVLDGNNTIAYVQYLEEMTGHPNYEKAISALRALA